MKTTQIDFHETLSHKYCLLSLSPDWSPWTHQIQRFVKDGSAYGRPRVAVCCSTENFTDFPSALAAFSAIKDSCK